VLLISVLLIEGNLILKHLKIPLLFIFKIPKGIILTAKYYVSYFVLTICKYFSCKLPHKNYSRMI
jgi:hypothetical protein